ncbi:MAG: PDZ domain-containing protein [Thalassotalea sp.]|nr:PDZ domain-containing protein [Thalassotalea sp.]
MNIVFNRVVLYVASKNIIVCLASLFIAFQLQAKECATIEFFSTEKNNENFVYFMSDHNGYRLSKSRNKYDIIEGDKIYYLEDGTHKVVVERWPLDSFRKIRKGKKIKNKYIPDDIVIQNLILNVRENHHYKFEFILDESKNPTIVMRSQSVKSCEKYRLLQAKDEIVQTEKPELSKDLEYRLRKIMTKIQSHHKNTDSNEKGNFFPLYISPFIGTSIDKDFVDNNTAIKVLSVLPYYFANNFNLKSGDKITHLNGVSINTNNGTPSELFNKYIEGLFYGDNFTATIVRNGKGFEISSEYKPKILPELSYQFVTEAKQNKSDTLINQKSLPSSLNVEFNELVLEIVEFYQQHDYQEKHAYIYRDEKQDKTFGFSGKRFVDSGVVGLRIEEILPGSIAEKLGLRTEDIITAINDVQINNENLTQLINSLAELKGGEKLRVTVKRERKTISLEGDYSPEQLAGFEIEMNLHSITLAKTALNKVKIRNNKYSRDRLIYGDLRHNNRASNRNGNQRPKNPYPLKGPVAPKRSN